MNIIFLLLLITCSQLSAAAAEHPLFDAIRKNDIKTVEDFLKNGANPNLQDNDGYTPLHLATTRGFETIVQILLKNEANVNMQNNDTDTPLYDAAINGFEGIVILLLKKKADPNKQNSFGDIALHVAAFYNYPNIVQLLLENDADPDIKNSFGLTAADSTKNVKIRKLLEVEEGLNIKG